MYFDVLPEQKKTDWKGFERAVGAVFEESGYKVLADVRFKTERRFQIDIIAYDNYRCFFVDCKDHRYINPSKEEDFVDRQHVRAENFLRSNPELAYKKKFILLVSRNKAPSLIWHEAGREKILAVDFSALNDLLVNIHAYEDELYSF